MGKELLKLARSLQEKKQMLERVTESRGSFLDKEIDKLWDLTAEAYGISFEVYLDGDKALCIISDYCQGEIKISKAHRQLKAISKKQENENF